VSPLSTAAEKIRGMSRDMNGSQRYRLLFQRIVYTLAFIHLCVIGTVIFHGTDSWLNQSWWQRPLVFWGGINYSLWRFGFFSPDVGKSSEIEFRVTQKDGQVRSFTTLAGFNFFTSNRESLIRFYGFRVQAAENPALQDLCARSVIVHLLNELEISQDVSGVDYILRSIRYPTMQGFRNGEPVRTEELYRTSFVMAQQ
jgi:hypothetical protein